MTAILSRLSGVNSSLAFKAPVRAATSSNITLFGFQTIDGVAIASTDQANGLNIRVLVKSQTDQTQNGIYDVNASAWTRSADFDANDDFISGTKVLVSGGSTQQGIWTLTTADKITLGTSLITFALDASLLGSAIEYVIDAVGVAITTGLKGFLECPVSGTLTQVTLLADQAGSMVVNVWKCSYTQFDGGATHPVAGDKITASAPPTITSSTKATDATLSGWTTSISKGDILAYNVDSTSGAITRVTISLRVSLPQ